MPPLIAVMMILSVPIFPSYFKKMALDHGITKGRGYIHLHKDRKPD
jgi:hypothetical protein